jgi:hypothetical protein
MNDPSGRCRRQHRAPGARREERAGNPANRASLRGATSVSSICPYATSGQAASPVRGKRLYGPPSGSPPGNAHENMCSGGRLLHRRDKRHCLVGIEACASSHHWSRQLQALGHTVRLTGLREAVRQAPRRSFGWPLTILVNARNHHGPGREGARLGRDQDTARVLAPTNRPLNRFRSAGVHRPG